MSETVILDEIDNRIAKLHLMTSNPKKWKLVAQMRKLVQQYRTEDDEL